MITEQRYRENLPNFSIWFVKSKVKPDSQRFWAGFVTLPNGFRVEYRHSFLKKLLHLRVAPNGAWQSVCMVRNRSNLKLRRMECPYCCACVEQIWAIGLNAGDWRCKFCCELPSAHRSSPRISKFRKAIRIGQLEVVMKGLKKGGMQALDARLAMEAEGLSPKKMLVPSSTRQNQMDGATVEKHRSRHRLRCRIGRGRLLFVDGELHVR